MSVLTPSLGHGGRLRRMWGLHVSLGHGRGGQSPLGSGCPLFNDFRADTSSEKGGEAGWDPRGHLWVTWGVYLGAGKPQLADIILSHPPDLT